MIEFQGRFDSNIATALNKRVFKKNWWVFVLCTLVFAGIGALLAVFAEDFSDLVLGVILICFGVLFTPLVLIISNRSQKKMNNSMNILSPDTTQIFQFYPDRLVITQRKGDEYEAMTSAKYSYLFSVEETAATYFLFISKVQSHVVNKADITQGTIEELNGIFASNLGPKFKKMK